MKNVDIRIYLIVFILADAFVKIFFDWSNLEKYLWIIGEVLLLAGLCYSYLFRFIIRSKIGKTKKALCFSWIIYTSFLLSAVALDQIIPGARFRLLILPFRSSFGIIHIFLSYYTWITLSAIVCLLVFKDYRQKRKKDAGVKSLAPDTLQKASRN